MSKQRIILLSLITLLVVAGLAVGVYLVKQSQETRSSAAPATTLTFVTSKVNPVPEETFTVDVKMDTGENLVATIKLRLSYNEGVITATSVSAGSEFTKVGSTTAGSGVVGIDLISGASGASGSGLTIARVIFTANSVGSSTVSVSSATEILAGPSGETTNVLISPLPQQTITVQTVIQPTATPVPTEVPGQPTATPVPTEVPGQPTVTPTSAPSGDSTSPTNIPTPIVTLPPDVPVSGFSLPTIGLGILGVLGILLGGILLI